MIRPGTPSSRYLDQGPGKGRRGDVDKGPPAPHHPLALVAFSGGPAAVRPRAGCTHGRCTNCGRRGRAHRAPAAHSTSRRHPRLYRPLALPGLVLRRACSSSFALASLYQRVGRSSPWSVANGREPVPSPGHVCAASSSTPPRLLACLVPPASAVQCKVRPVPGQLSRYIAISRLSRCRDISRYRIVTKS